MEPSPKITSVSEKIYRKLLRLYPQSHRRDYAEQMTQLFRDQCRDAWRTKRSAGIFKLWLRVLPDIAKTSIVEQITAFERNQIMKYLNAKNAPTILLIVGLALGLFSFLFTFSPRALDAIVLASFILIFAKALIELFRPSNEWLKIMIRTFLLMFIFAIYMPAWAKATGFEPLPPIADFGWNGVCIICLMSNPIVAAIKLLQFLIQRRKN